MTGHYGYLFLSVGPAFSPFLLPPGHCGLRVPFLPVVPQSVGFFPLSLLLGNLQGSLFSVSGTWVCLLSWVGAGSLGLFSSFFLLWVVLVWVFFSLLASSAFVFWVFFFSPASLVSFHIPLLRFQCWKCAIMNSEG